MDGLKKASELDSNKDKSDLEISERNIQKPTKKERIEKVRRQFEEYGFRLYKSTDGYYTSGNKIKAINIPFMFLMVILKNY